MVRFWMQREEIKLLETIDSSDDIDVTDWEASFIDGIFRQSFQPTDKQMAVIRKINDKYESML